jgi:DNA-dependent RNA polymerase auxiliary subunit epsilon
LIEGLEDFTEVGEATQMESMSLKKLRRKLDSKKEYHVEYTNKHGNFISTTVPGIQGK